MDPEAAALLEEARAAFAFLTRRGYRESAARLVSEQSFKGGFLLDYSDGKSALRVQYLDAELEVSCDGVELFGSNQHPGFGGNMFSRQPLREALQRIAASVRKLLPAPPVLVVAEKDSISEITAECLRSDGFRVETVSSAVEAFRKAEKRRPAAIVAEWKMSGFHGTELLFMIRNHAELRDLPFVLLALKNSWYDELTYLKALPWQADAYVFLPCGRYLLVREVRALAERSSR